jgi:hypothetical protein
MIWQGTGHKTISKNLSKHSDGDTERHAPTPYLKINPVRNSSGALFLMG